LLLLLQGAVPPHRPQRGLLHDLQQQVAAGLVRLR
jgi:hypothetical protein